MQVGRDRLAQRQDAVGRGVAVMALGERAASGLDDVLRGGEIRLADAEIDDVAALALQRRGACQDLEGGLGAEAAHAPGQDGHGCGPFGKSGRVNDDEP